MCKFNNYLFILISFSYLKIDLINCQPMHLLDGLMHNEQSQQQQQYEQHKDGNKDLNDLLTLSLLAATAPKDDYNLHYDQRQKGAENYRLKLDGFFIGLPQEDDSALLMLTEELLESLDEELTLDKNKVPSFLSKGSNASKPEMDLNLSSSSLLSSSLSSSLSSASPSSLSPMNSKPEMVLVELAAIPKQQEARNSFISPYGNTDHPLRPKSYLYRLLNMLKQHSP